MGKTTEQPSDPAYLQAARRLRGNRAKLLAQMESAPEPFKSQILEDLESLQEGLYLSGLAAVQGGTLSHERIIAAVQEACDDLPDDDGGEGPQPVSPYQVLGTFSDRAVFAQPDGRLYRVAYHMEGTVAFLDGEPVEVTAEFTPIAGAQQEGAEALAEAQALVESRPSRPWGAGHLNRETNTIEGTTLITSASSNGVNRKRKYSENALKQIAAMAEGIPAYANHVSPELAFKPRDVKDLIGRHVNVRYDAGTGSVKSDLQLLEHHAPWVFSLAERLGDQVGNSLVSKGLVRMEGDTEVVDEIVALRSGDLVSDPASTRGLFESQVGEDDSPAFLRADRALFQTLAESAAGGAIAALRFPTAAWKGTAAQTWATAHGFTPVTIQEGETATELRLTPQSFPRTKTIRLTPDGARHEVSAVIGFPTTIQEALDMEMNAVTITQYLKEHADVQKQVGDLLGYVPKTDASKLQEAIDGFGKEKQTLTESIATLSKERDGLKVEVDGFKAKEAVAAKRVKLQEAIDKHDLGKKFGKVKEVVSDVFVASLMEADETKWGGLLDDRYTSMTKAQTGQRPRSEGKVEGLSEGAEGERGTLHERLREAVIR